MPTANAQSVEYGATNVKRTQTVLEGTRTKSYTPPKDPIFEVQKKAVYDSGKKGFREVEVVKGPPESVKVGATIYGDKVEADVSVVQFKAEGVDARVLGAGADASYVVGVEGGNIQVVGKAGFDVYLLKVKVGGDKEIGDENTNLTGTARGVLFVGGEAEAKGRAFAGTEGLGLEVGGEAFAGAKVEGTLALKAMICKLGAGAGLTGQASAGAGVSVGAGLSVDWSKLEVTVAAKLAATLGLGAGLKGSVVISLEGLFDPEELARCLGEKAKAVHAAGVEGTRLLIQPAFDWYYTDPATKRSIARLEASNREFQRKRQLIVDAMYDERERVRAIKRAEALENVELISLADFPILYWDGRLIPFEVYDVYAKKAVDMRNLKLISMGFSPYQLGITPAHYGVQVKLREPTRYWSPDAIFFPDRLYYGPQRSNSQRIYIGPTRLLNHYPH
jgi:hypothetical protein